MCKAKYIAVKDIDRDRSVCEHKVKMVFEIVMGTTNTIMCIITLSNLYKSYIKEVDVKV
jgi:hypothetical protein